MGDSYMKLSIQGDGSMGDSYMKLSIQGDGSMGDRYMKLSIQGDGSHLHEDIKPAVGVSYVRISKQE